MSRIDRITNTVYVSVEFPFKEAWDDLDSEEQKSIVLRNIDMIDTDDLITELEHRGYCVTEEQE